jgi:hypothetical protein
MVHKIGKNRAHHDRDAKGEGSWQVIAEIGWLLEDRAMRRAGHAETKAELGVIR